MGTPARQEMRVTGVIGGMLAATSIATLFMPVIVRWIAAWGGQRPVSVMETK